MKNKQSVTNILIWAVLILTMVGIAYFVTHYGAILTRN